VPTFLHGERTRRYHAHTPSGEFVCEENEVNWLEPPIAPASKIRGPLLLRHYRFHRSTRFREPRRSRFLRVLLGHTFMHNKDSIRLYRLKMSHSVDKSRGPGPYLCPPRVPLSRLWARGTLVTQRIVLPGKPWVSHKSSMLSILTQKNFGLTIEERKKQDWASAPIDSPMDL